MFSFNPRTKRHREILAVESNGFTLRAAVVCADGDEIRVRQVEESQKSDPYEALTEVIENLDRAKIPASAILLVPEASAAILELPVDPKAPRPAAEMQELVRWELESQIVRNIGTAPIGEILVGRGYLTYEQVDVVCEEIDQRIHASGTSPHEDAAVMPLETELRKIPGSRSSPRYTHRFGETRLPGGSALRDPARYCF